MAKSKKTTPSVDQEVETTATGRLKAPVLIKVTAAKLIELIGDEVEIGVSRKELTNIILKGKRDAVLAEAGL